MFFANPTMLWALSAAIIPILVHLFNFRRHKTVYFSNVDMIQALQNETKRQRNVRQLLVLLCRILAIVFLVLAFARPTLSKGSMQLKQGNTAVSIYVDNSFSVANTHNDGSLLEVGKQKAREIVSTHNATDRFQLITNDARGHEHRHLTKDEIQYAIDEIDYSPVSSNLAQTARKQYDFLQSTHCSNLYAYQISDFQQTCTSIPDYPRDTNISTILVPLAGLSVNNVFVDSLAFRAPAFFANNTVTVDVHIRNNSDSPVEDIPLKLFVNDRQRAIASVSMQAGEQLVQSLTFPIGDDRILNGYVELMDYPIVFDDKFFFSINVNTALSVLCINGDSENEALRRLFDNDSAVSYTTLPERNIDLSSFAGNNLIVLNELRDIPSGVADALRDYVDQGGNLLVVPSKESNLDAYNHFLLSLKAPALQTFERQKRQLTKINNNNQLYAGVFSGTPSDIDMPTLNGYYKLNITSNTVYTPVIYSDNGISYIGSTAFGKGNVYLVATPLRTEYTDFVQQPMFVPTFYNMALHGARLGCPYYTFGANNNIELPRLTLDANTQPTVKQVGGDFEAAAEIRHTGSQPTLKLPAQLVQAGNYLVGDDALSFNYSRSESFLEFYNSKQLHQQLSENRYTNFKIIQNASNPIVNQIQQLHEGVPLWRYCIVLVLLFVLVETLLLRITK